MKKLLVGGALAAALAMPAGAVAQNEPKPEDFKNASKFCKALKRHAGSQNFAAMFGGGRNAHGKCVSQTARRNSAEDARQEQEARRNASQQCREERQQNPQAFADRYGTNRNDRNAFGKCVSQKARENKQEADEQDEAEQNATLNAAKKCKRARQSDSQAFAAKYGSRRNAFGKCVSQTARGGGENAPSGQS